MKRILSIIFAVMLIISCTGCISKSSESPESTGGTQVWVSNLCVNCHPDKLEQAIVIYDGNSLCLQCFQDKVGIYGWKEVE